MRRQTARRGGDHRHKDHISGFATSNGKGPGDIIASCEPGVVIQPWTEDPDAKPDATSATRLSDKKSFVGALDSMHGFSESLLTELHALWAGISLGVQAARVSRRRQYQEQVGG